MNANDILAWHDWFLTVAPVSATLAGLLFVGLTISLEHVLSASGYLNRAFTALYLQFQALVIGLFGLIPGQSTTALGAEFIVTGLAFLAGILAFAYNFREDEQSHVLGSKWPRRVRRVIALSAILLPVVAGLSLIARWGGGLYWLMPAEIACLYLSIGNAWVFAIEIPRRKRAGI